MKKENNPVSQEKFKTLIGGQALIEGIMMRGPKKQAVVVRKPDGELEIQEKELKFMVRLSTLLSAQALPLQRVL